jgi:hypothetical protein
MEHQEFYVAFCGQEMASRGSECYVIQEKKRVLIKPDMLVPCPSTLELVLVVARPGLAPSGMFVLGPSSAVTGRSLAT